jgi:general secretion pathway protein D
MKLRYGLIHGITAIVTAVTFLAGSYIPLLAQDAMTAEKNDGMTVKNESKAEPEKPAAAKKEEKKSPSKKKKVEAPRTFTLNFKDIEIAEFLNFMGRIIGKNIIIDDSVRGKISIISNKEVPLSEAFEVTKAILEVKGFAIIETNNLLKVMPIREAIKKNTEIVVDSTTKLEVGNQKTLTYLLELQNADAPQLAQVMQPLKSQFTDIVVYPALNTIIFSGSSNEIEGLLKIARALDKAPEKAAETAKKERGNIHVVPLEYANAEDLANVLSRVPFSEVAFLNTEEPAQIRQSAAANRIAGQPVAQQSQQNKSKLSIIASKDANALIVTATPKEFEEIERLIKKLDVVREQVLIEALIVEVAANNGWNWGIDWEIGANAGAAAIGGSQLLSGSLPTYSTINGKTTALPTNTGFQIGFLGSSSILSFGLLNMAKSDSDANILSTPQILTTDNQEAEINVGDQIPVASASTSASSTTTNYSFDYKSVGVKLKLTPHITHNDRISIDLYMEVNDITGESQVVGTTIVPPTLSKRDIKTKITVPNTKTVVVGGLIKNKKSMTETKVPLLGDIPLLGWLFTNKTVSNKKTNLLVFITPTLLTKPENMDIVTQQKKEEQKLLIQNKD